MIDNIPHFFRFKGENYSKEKVIRPRSRTSPLPNNDLPEKARRAHSSGALVVVNNEKPSSANKVKTYHSVGSITRRTPVKIAQSHAQKDSEKHDYRHLHFNTSSVKNHPEHSFQNNNKTVINNGRRPALSRTNAGKRKSDKKSEYVSVATLIQQWSSAEVQEKIPAKLSSGSKTNRRSLPANFPRNNNLSGDDEPQLRRAKSITADTYSKIRNDCPHKTSTANRSTATGLQGKGYQPRGDVRHRQAQHSAVTRRAAEPIKNYATTDSSTISLESKMKGSSIPEADNNYQNEIIVNEKRTSQATKTHQANSPFDLLSDSEREKFRDGKTGNHNPKEFVVDNRRRSEPINKNSFDLTPSERAQLGSSGSYGNSDVHHHKQPNESIRDHWRNTQPFGKYATMPARQRKDYENESIGKNERKAELGTGRDDWTSSNREDTRRKDKSVHHPNLSNNNMKKKKPSLRRLPTYEEAIEPLQGTDLRDGNERCEGTQNPSEIEQPSTRTPLYLFLDPSEPSIDDKRNKIQGLERKRSVKETVIKQSVLPIKNTVEFDSLFRTNDSLETEAKRRYEKHYLLASNGRSEKLHHQTSNARSEKLHHQTSNELRKSPLENKAIKQNDTVVFPNEFTHKSSSSNRKSSKITSHVSYSKDETDKEEEISLSRDDNNNTLSDYDEQTLKVLLASQQRRRGREVKRGEDFAKVEENKRKDLPTSQGSTAKRENKVASVNELLKQQQKSILDEDFKQRERSRMTPDVDQEFNKQDDVSFSSVVHDTELVELVAAEEKYWKEKVEKKSKVTEDYRKKLGKANEKQKRVDEMLREYKLHEKRDSKHIDYSEMTDTLRAEEEYLAQEAEKLLKQRFQEKFDTKNPVLTTKVSQMHTKSEHKIHPVGVRDTKSLIKRSLTGYPGMKNRERFDHVNVNKVTSRSIVSPVPISRRIKSPSISSDDINLKPEVDQAYHKQTRIISRSRSPVYVCSGCRLPVERDICLYVSELQSYWHEKCFRCSVCHSNLIRGRSTPKIRVMYSRIHCENCISNRKTGEFSFANFYYEAIVI